MSPRLWSIHVFIGVLAILGALALLAWMLLHPVPHWPEFDMKDAGGERRSPEPVVVPPFVGA